MHVLTMDTTVHAHSCRHVSELVAFSFFNSITRNQGDVTIRAGLLTMLKGRSLHTTPPNTVANTCLNIHQLNVQSAEKMKSVKALVSHNAYDGRFFKVLEM